MTPWEKKKKRDFGFLYIYFVLSIFIKFYIIYWLGENKYVQIMHGIFASKLIYVTLPIYDQISHLKEFARQIMHSEFRNSSKHGKVGAGKVRSTVGGRKVIALTWQEMSYIPFRMWQCVCIYKRKGI